MTQLPHLLALTLLGALNCGGVADLPPQPAPAADASATCPGPTTACAGACVDLSKDPMHCGTCGHECGPGDACSRGMRALACAGGTTRCGDLCVNTALDPANCGKCGAACSAGQVCSTGACSLECFGGTTKCGQACADLKTDVGNCGACSKACHTGAFCVGGVCTDYCPVGTAPCDGKCVDLKVDPANCGACGVSCGLGELCSAGQCLLVCPAGQTSCGGQCFNLSEDSGHCGSCDVTCAPGEVCAMGACALECPTGLVACEGACRDPQTSNGYCGASGDCLGPNLGTTCPTGTACVAGLCSLSCQDGLTDCSGTCSNLLKDPENCGGCGLTCAAGNFCNTGVCELVCVPPLLQCGAACINPQFDPGNCGACGNVCDVPNGMAACLSGACAVTGCIAGFADCNHDVADGCENELNTDSHCGYCDLACDPAIAFCRAGMCAACAGPPSAVDQVQLKSDFNTCLDVNALNVSEQTFTAGASGVLAGIEVALYRHWGHVETGGVKLTLFDASTLAALASAVLPPSTFSDIPLPDLDPGLVPGPTYFDLSSACLHVTAGQSLRMRFEETDPVAPQCVAFHCNAPYGWSCILDSECEDMGFHLGISKTNAYAFGMAYCNSIEIVNWDLAFKTYIR